MGSASSVSNDSTFAPPSSNRKDVAGGEARSDEGFSAHAHLLASKYHDLRLRGRDDVGGEGRIAPLSLLAKCTPPSIALRSKSSPSPLPRAERKRMSRHLQRDEAVQQNGGSGSTVASATTDGGGGSAEPGQTGLPLEASVVADTTKHATHEESQQRQFVCRDETVGLARELGYDVTPEQATKIFDMLDSLGQGQTSKDDICKYFLPLLKRTGHSGPPRKSSTGRRKSSKGVSPRRPRPSTSRPSGSKTPPRPAGTPPQTAKRRVTLSPPEGPGNTCSPGPASSNLTSPSRTEKRKSSTNGILDPISSPNHLRERPSKFWLNPSQSRDLAPASTSLTPPTSTAGQVDESRSCHDDSVEKMEKLGETKPDEIDEKKKDLRAARGGTGGELEPANGLSVTNKSAGGSEDGKDGDADDKKTVAAPGGSERESGSRSSMSMNSKPATADLLYGKNVLDWTSADVLTWIRALPRGLAAFAEADAFANARVDGKRLAKLKLSDIKRKEFRHAKFKAKIPTALWVEIKQIQQTVPTPTEAVATAPALPSRFAPGQTIMDETVNTPLCTVKKPVGQGAFGEVYQVVWTGIGADRGSTMAMKTTRLADISSNERDEYRVLLMEEILTAVRVKPHSNVVNVRFAHIMGFCSESEEYFCFEDFVTGKNLEELIAEGEGELYGGTPAEVQGRLLSYSIQLARGLGHIHRCGVLHEDIKSANIMVSSDAELLITDFGFAAVGHFAPPLLATQKPGSVTSMTNTAGAATDSTDGVSESTGEREPQGRHDIGGAGQRTGAREAQGFRSKTGGAGRPPNRDSVLYGNLKGYTPRYQSPEVNEIMEQKCKAAAATAAAAAMATAQAGDRLSQSHVPQKTGVADEPHSPFTHRSDMWAAGVVILEMYAGGLAALEAARGDNALSLLETCARHTTDVTTPAEESGRMLTPERRVNTQQHKEGGGDGANDTGKGAGQPWAAARAVGGAGSSLPRWNGETKNPIAFRVAMPEGVLAELRGIFQHEAGDRPESLEVLAERLSQTLAGMLEENIAVVPCATTRAPSPFSLCEEPPACVECEENQAKVGRLHMWLGKALFLKGEDRREQALQEYREGVRVLSQSKTECRSSSMALFRWYLGKALLENGEIDEALPHLVEAVSIDPESAKYRHTLGLVKCATGDEAGAREDLLEAALLDEEDAEDRYQLRMQRISEKRRRYDEHQQKLQRSPASEEAGALQVRRFSVGEEIVCEPPAFSLQKIFEPLRCCHSSYRNEADSEADRNEIFTIDKLLPLGQASLHFPGEAYTATGMAMEQGQQTDGSRSFHAVYVRFEPDKHRPAIATGTAPKEEEGALATLNGHKQLAPIGENEQTERGADAITNASPVGVMSAPVTSASPGDSSSRSSTSRGSLSPTRSLSPTNAMSLRGPTHVHREEEYVPMLKAAGRAAMVGFHAQLAGAVRHLTWGPGELTLVADNIPSACSTLLEVCVSGSLYRGTGNTSAEGGWSRPKASEDKNINSSVVVDRMLELARQTAAAISHCHSRGILLRDITPNEVLVTPQWNAILRPNYAHAHEGRSWATVSVLKQQGAPSIDRPCSVLDDKRLVAPFTNVVSSDYQSPEIARIRSENEPPQRVSGRALRLSAATAPSNLLATGRQGEQAPSLSPTGGRPSTSAERAGAGEREQSGSGYIVGGGGDGEGSSGADDTLMHHQRGNGGSSEHQLQADSSQLARNTRRSLDRRRGGADSTGRKLGPSPSTVPGGGSGEPPMMSACESDIWAWALMVLQMFSDEPWPPGNGQKGLAALEALLRRRKGVDVWTTDDVITWLRDIGLWSEKTEREIRAFKIAGPQLLVPTCRRDIVERLGLFIADGNLSCKLWASIAGGLQRWSIPHRLAQVLRRCLADSPDDRISTMDEVCRLLRGIAADDSCDDKASAVHFLDDDDENIASNKLRTGLILNDIGVCLFGRGLADDAERYYKMALLSSQDIVEAYYNLGLLYIAPAFNKFHEARQMFDAATEKMGNEDRRRKASIEHSKAAERKSNYHQSQEMMKALSGKYSVSPRGRQRGSGGGAVGSAARKKHPSGGGAIGEDDSSRRSSFPPEHKSRSPLERSSASTGTPSSPEIGHTERTSF